MQKETERREKAEYIAREIIAEARGRLVLHFPYLDQAIYGLRPLPLKSVPFGSDGSFLFYDPIFLIDQYERDENSALKLLLHTTLHMLFRQALIGVRIQRPLWNLACDIAVEHLTESFDLPGLKSGREEARKDVYGKLQREGVYMSAEAVYAWLCEHPPADPEYVLYRDLFQRDSHRVWYRREDEIQLPESLLRIEDNAFWSLSDLKHITVPGRNTAIGLNAFGGCESLSEGYVARGYPGPEACDPPAELLYTLLLLSSGGTFPEEAVERAVRYAREYEDLLIERILATNAVRSLEGMVSRNLLTPGKIPDYVKAAAKAKRPELSAILLGTAPGPRGGAAGRFAL